MGCLEDDLTEAKRMWLRDEKIAKLSGALQAMVDRWEPDCDGQDRIMWENACEALAFAADHSLQSGEYRMTHPLTIDDRTIRARKFASQIMAIIQDCVSDKVGAESRLIDAAYHANAEIVAMCGPEAPDGLPVGRMPNP